jgi:signal transduction histidine kinase
VAASLLIRQSALVRVEGQRLLPLYAHGISQESLPAAPATFAGQVGYYRAPIDRPGKTELPEGLRLILPLSIETQVIGYWLLGRRDPDDDYSIHDISILATIANQTAIALHNILQTQRLHALYQNDIGRDEEARAALARELHDQVLNELGLLWRSASQTEPHMEESFQRLSSSLRHTITGLRPAAVDFGLRLALADLVDRMSGNNGSMPKVELNLGESDADYQRHAPDVELHLYRIVQQAFANALQYSHAKHIAIRGTLHNDAIELVVEDDGVGFETSGEPDVAQLVARQHFGVAGMVERAHLIGARIQVHSTPGKGTCIQVMWKANGRPPEIAAAIGN